MLNRVVEVFITALITGALTGYVTMTAAISRVDVHIGYLRENVRDLKANVHELEKLVRETGARNRP